MVYIVTSSERQIQLFDTIYWIVWHQSIDDVIACLELQQRCYYLEANFACPIWNYSPVLEMYSI